MRHGTSSRRQRNRNSNGGGSRRNNSQQRMQVFDSNGPDVRIRGTAHQVAEKYLALAKDAASAGDNIVAENYYQHAEHYIRIINEYNGSFGVSKAKNESLADDIGNKSELDEAVSTKEARPVEDLSLPASILGEASSADSAVEEMAD